MVSTFRPVPRWKVFAVLLGALALVAFGFWLWVRSVADRKWAAMDKQVQALQKEVESRDPRRPVLQGDPLPGNAWHYYSRAMEGLSDEALRRDLGEFVNQTPEADRSKVDAALASHGSALGDLKRGARCGEAKALLSSDIGAALDELRREGIRVDGRVAANWRFVWSERLMKADAFSRALEWHRQAEGSGAKTWAEENRLWEAIGLECKRYLEETENLALSYIGSFPHGPHKNVRERRAQLRVLRVLVQYLATGEVLDLADPFGDRLRCRRAGEKLRVWSVGWNGLDDGGVGSWTTHSNQDIVLEVSR